MHYHHLPKPDFLSRFKCWLICLPGGDFCPCLVSLSELSASPFFDSDPWGGGKKMQIQIYMAPLGTQRGHLGSVFYLVQTIIFFNV